MKIAILLLALGISINSLADINQERDRELLLENRKNVEIHGSELSTYPEIYLQKDSVLKERINSTGLSSEPYYTRQDSTRLSFSFSFSVDYEDLTKIQSFDAVYSNQFDNSYKDLWWGVHFLRTSAQYDAIADERSSDTGSPDSVANTARRDNLQTLSIFGFGLSHRFKTFSEAWGTDRVFEFISVYANYIFHNDQTDDEKYSGIGYTADYSLTYRSSERIFYGGKISYNWALLDRPQVDEEDLIDRSLVFGWTSIGFEAGYIF
jgi:hypothetical protein